MGRLMRGLVLGWLALVAGAAAAEEISYHGCTDAAGRAVVSRADAGLAAVVESSVEGGRPLIRYNPAAIERLQPNTRLFLFAHECARHNLALPVSGVRSLESARRADCAGLATLLRSRLLSEADVGALEADLLFSDDEWRMLPGPQREFDFAACRTTGNILALRGNPEPPRRGWNSCVHACGERLRACQGAARPAPRDCVEANDRCVLGCDSLPAD